MFDKVTLEVFKLPKNYNIFNNAKIKHYGRNPHKGRYKNMIIWQYPNYFKITGSLAKYLHDENVTPLKMEEVEQAIINLEKDIDLILDNAVVSYVEFGTSVKVKEYPFEYMNLFGHTNRLNKIVYAHVIINKPFKRVVSNRTGIETVDFNTPTGSFGFTVYDKHKEMSDNKKFMPSSFQDHNVLRLEYKILDREGIQAKFKNFSKTGDLTAHDLFDEKVYKKFKELFLEKYNSIEKMGKLVYVDKPEKITPKVFTEMIAEQFRQSHPEEYQQHLQRFIEAGKIDLKKNFSLKKELSLKKTIERIKGENNKLGRDNSFSDTNLLIKELDDLVYNSVMLGD